MLLIVVNSDRSGRKSKSLGIATRWLVNTIQKVALFLSFYSHRRLINFPGAVIALVVQKSNLLKSFRLAASSELHSVDQVELFDTKQGKKGLQNNSGPMLSML